jgi:nicotinamide phosphoribosyltransferase
MYPERTTKIYSNLTPRKSRIKGVDKVVVFGIQYFIIEYLIRQWDKEFFGKPKNVVISEYKRMLDYTLGKDSVDTTHIEALHSLGYLPLKIKALPEGSLCPIGVPMLTITNTVDHAYWLVNYLETILSCVVWQPITSATIALQYRKLLNKYALETTGSIQGVEWQGHDFSMRGMSSLESACTSGAGHLLSFNGTDTIPAIDFLEKYYYADIMLENVGASVPATEHSVMCMGTKDDEVGTFDRLLDLYPEGILSVVSDTWDLWKVCTEYLPLLKDKILARNGKLVIRPDSGDPVHIICGKNYHKGSMSEKELNESEKKGVIELLWDVFGGTVNEKGYKVLDPHIGAIYGDSITIERAEAICERLKAKGFASSNIVFGIGSYAYQMNTRDTFGFAVKATYGELTKDVRAGFDGDNEVFEKIVESREIFKAPITDDGTKKSAKGLLKVQEVLVPDSLGKLHHSTYVLKDQVSKEEEEQGALKTVFKDGLFLRQYSLSDIRNRLKNSL